MSNETVLADEKPAEEVETSETTTEKTEQPVDSEANVEKAEEKSPYEVELEKLKAEKAKSDAIARQKDGALKEERRLRKEAEAKIKGDTEEKENPKYLTPEEAKQLLKEQLAERDFSQMLTQISADPAEQALIKEHYENSIVKTGNVAEDLKKATAIANQHLVEQAKAAQMEREASEGNMTRFMPGTSYRRSGQPAYEGDPTLRAAAQFFDKIGRGDMKKYLNK